MTAIPRKDARCIEIEALIASGKAIARVAARSGYPKGLLRLK